MTADDLLKRIERLAHEAGAFAIIRDREQQKAFEKALMRFGLACYQECIQDVFAAFDYRAPVGADDVGLLAKTSIEAAALLAGRERTVSLSRACGGCGGHAHQMVDGDQSWLECTHGCGWSSRGATQFPVG